MGSVKIKNSLGPVHINLKPVNPLTENALF